MKRKGEIKNCTTCDKEYEHFSTNRYSLCKRCREKAYLERNRLTEDEYKKPYPLNPNDKKNRYARLRRELAKCYDRNEWREMFAKELEYMEQIGITLWCMDRRTDGKKALVEHGKKGRKPSGVTDMKKKWPDTRSWYD